MSHPSRTPHRVSMPSPSWICRLGGHPPLAGASSAPHVDGGTCVHTGVWITRFFRDGSASAIPRAADWPAEESLPSVLAPNPGAQQDYARCVQYARNRTFGIFSYGRDMIESTQIVYSFARDAFILPGRHPHYASLQTAEDAAGVSHRQLLSSFYLFSHFLGIPQELFPFGPLCDLQTTISWRPNEVGLTFPSMATRHNAQRGSVWCRRLRTEDELLFRIGYALRSEHRTILQWSLDRGTRMTTGTEQQFRAACEAGGWNVQQMPRDGMENIACYLATDPNSVPHVLKVFPNPVAMLDNVFALLHIQYLLAALGETQLRTTVPTVIGPGWILRDHLPESSLRFTPDDRQLLRELLERPYWVNPDSPSLVIAKRWVARALNQYGGTFRPYNLAIDRSATPHVVVLYDPF